jgi:hypothetical protein
MEMKGDPGDPGDHGCLERGAAQRSTVMRRRFWRAMRAGAAIG